MRRNILIALIVASMNALGEDIKSSVVVISPFASKAQLSAVWAAQRQLVLENAPKESLVRVVDGWELTTIADFRIPDSENPKVRNRELMPQIKSVFEWFKRSGKTESELKGTGALRITGLVDFFRDEIDEGTSVLLAGSPLVVFPSESEFSFRNPGEGPDQYWVPSDGQIRASVNRTPYGLQGMDERFQGARFEILYSGESIFPTPAYKGRVQRFWSLWFSSAGGKFTGFGADTRRSFNGLFSSDGAIIEADFDARLRKLRMLNITRDIERGTLTNNVPYGVFKPMRSRGSGSDRTFETESEVVDEFERLSDEEGAALSIGILWDASVDVDLYVMADDDKPLSFRNRSNFYGRYLRDITSGNGVSWETVVLDVAPASSLEVFANLYSSRLPRILPVKGKMMVRHGDVTNTSGFAISAWRGNSGARFNQRHSDKHWVSLPVEQIVSLASAE